MARYGFHIHKCAHADIGCREEEECSDSNLERNYDGWPEVICRNHEYGAECDDCRASKCDECGSILTLEKHDPDCERRTA